MNNFPICPTDNTLTYLFKFLKYFKTIENPKGISLGIEFNKNWPDFSFLNFRYVRALSWKMKLIKRVDNTLGNLSAKYSITERGKQFIEISEQYETSTAWKLFYNNKSGTVTPAELNNMIIRKSPTDS